MRKLKAYLRPSLTAFCLNFFYSACRKNGEEYEPTTVFSFEHLSQRYLMQQSIVTPTPPTSGNSGDMDFQRCHDLKFPNPLEHSSL